MKRLAHILTLLFVNIVIAQNPIEKTIGEFNEIKVYDLIEVTLIHSTENKIIIKGQHNDEVDYVNKGGKLKLRMKLNYVFNGDDTEIEVYYTKLDLIDGNEGSIISTQDPIKQDFVELRGQEGAELRIDMEVNKLEVKSISGAVINTSGTANTQDISVNTGGNYLGEDLNTKTTKVSIHAGGIANVNASNTVDATAQAGGTINVYGNPETLIKHSALGGKIKQK